MGEAVLGTGFGIIIGPHGANIFNPRSWGSSEMIENKITLEVMRIVLATGLFAIGVELPKAYLAEHARSLLIMVVPMMAFGWFIVAGIILALFPSLSFISSLAIAACLTPTDPILAAAIIGGKFAIRNVPSHVRRVLSAESAANDGLAYPFLSISIYLAVEESKRSAFGKWFLIGWLYQVILGTVLGAVLGLAFSHLMRISYKKGLIDRESYVAQYLALAIFTVGLVSTIGSDDLLAAFAAGSAISWDGHFKAHTENELFSSVIDLVLNCACFIYIGAWLPFNQFNSPDLGIVPWKLVVLFIGILLLRRIPSMIILYKWIPEVKTLKEALFCGHFGPMGVGAVFISTLAVTELQRSLNEETDGSRRAQNELLKNSLHPIVGFVVLGSILIHGLSIPVFWFGRSVHMHVRTMSRTMSLAGTRTTTITATGVLPEWAIGIRRSPTGSLFERNVRAREESGAGAKLSKNDINEEDRDWDAENTATTVSLQEIGETRVVLENQVSKA
ncbi:Sodium hydrogen exchanger [Pyrrhoderma noxium]|uniref:Sodium hydrogen exchanger n=1 Tax=Pyrrhoderma noxium TaxID=2282107 RepID=A0A286UUC0_9AGAM|nr:Sodium hydrogen exchanger [Pyrrhoderma noxium]